MYLFGVMYTKRLIQERIGIKAPQGLFPLGVGVGVVPPLQHLALSRCLTIAVCIIPGNDIAVRGRESRTALAVSPLFRC